MLMYPPSDQDEAMKMVLMISQKQVLEVDPKVVVMMHCIQYNDIIAISLVAFHSCLLSVFSSSEGALIASSAHQKDIIVIPALPCAFSLQDADLDQPHWLRSLDRVHSSSPWQQFVVLLV